MEIIIGKVLFSFFFFFLHDNIFQFSGISTVVTQDNESRLYIGKLGDEELELPLFDLYTISTATNNFSFTYKIGEGGFGAVYKVVYF